MCFQLRLGAVMTHGLSRSEEQLASLPTSLQRLMTFERHHLYKIEFFQKWYTGIDSRYFPQNSPVFHLPCYWVRRNELQIHDAGRGTLESIGFRRGSGRAEELLFPVHPLMVQHYSSFLQHVGAKLVTSDGPRLLAIPTSSPRTLLAWPEASPNRALFIKTTMLLEGDGGDWRLYDHKIAYCVGLTKLLQQPDTLAARGLEFMPEPTAIVPRSMRDSGVLIRLIAEEIVRSDVVVAPLFSLIGGVGPRVPLLITLLREYAIRPLEFIEAQLCARFATILLQTMLWDGLCPEAHSQNLMLVFTPEMQPLGRFYYKDFEGLVVDWNLRKSIGLPTPANMPRGSSWYQTYSSMFPGAPHWELSWMKMRVSLYAYLHQFLAELNATLIEWRRRRIISGPAISEDYITGMFSWHVASAASVIFGKTVTVDYDVHRHLLRFVTLLGRIRRQIMMRGHR